MFKDMIARLLWACFMSFMLVGDRIAWATDYVTRATGSPSAYWSSRVLGRPTSTGKVIDSRPIVTSQVLQPDRATEYSIQTPRTRFISENIQPVPEMIPPGEPITPVEGVEDGEYLDSAFVPVEDNLLSCGSGYCEGACYGCFPFGPWIQHLSVFAGAHGFKGTADLGRNGNFGLHEGLNYSAPLGGPWNIGYQVGVQVVHSDFAGHQTLTWYGQDQITNASRAQMFFTAGLFRRPECDRWQWSVLFDWMHDDYYVDSDLLQIRHEISFFLDDQREIGYMGMYGVKDDLLLLRDGNEQERRYLDLSVLDRYAMFYRWHFCRGGEGRFWAGVSGYGDGLIGGDVLLPLDRSLALEANFAYLAPNTGTGADGQMDEHWSLSIGLVWYPGRPVDEALGDLFRSVQGVADNTSMMFHGRIRNSP